MEVNAIIERLKNHYKITSNQTLADMLSIDPSTLSSWKKRNSMDFRLLAKLPDIDLHWLITGESFEGESAKVNKALHISTKDFIRATQKKSYLPTLLIPEKAHAGYLSGFTDEFTTDLPVMQFGSYRNGHQFRFFEIAGNSMEQTLFAGDYVLCEREEAASSLKEGSIYVLHTNEGIVCKRIEKQTDKTLILHSDNQKYQDKSIALQEIVELWRVIWLHKPIK